MINHGVSALFPYPVFVNQASQEHVRPLSKPLYLAFIIITVRDPAQEQQEII